MTDITEPQRLSDVLLGEVDTAWGHSGFCRVTYKINAAAGMEIGDLAKVNGGEAIPAATGAAATLICLENVDDNENASFIYRGPCAVRLDGLYVADVDYTSAVAVFEALYIQVVS